MVATDYTRRVTRQAVLKTAKVFCQDTVYDCLLVDISEAGARIRLATATPLPDRFTVRFAGGAAFECERRWARGPEVGLAFIGTAGLGSEAQVKAWALYESMRDTGLPAIKRLAELNYFDDPGLRALATDMEAAWEKLEGALRARGQG